MVHKDAVKDLLEIQMTGSVSPEMTIVFKSSDIEIYLLSSGQN